MKFAGIFISDKILADLEQQILNYILKLVDDITPTDS